MRSSSAPGWAQLPNTGDGFVLGLNSEPYAFGTTWLIEALVMAGRHYLSDYLQSQEGAGVLTVLAASGREGGVMPANDGTSESGHQTGLELRMQLPLRSACSVDWNATRAQISALLKAGFTDIRAKGTCSEFEDYTTWLWMPSVFQGGSGSSSEPEKGELVAKLEPLSVHDASNVTYTWSANTQAMMPLLVNATLSTALDGETATLALLGYDMGLLLDEILEISIDAHACDLIEGYTRSLDGIWNSMPWLARKTSRAAPAASSVVDGWFSTMEVQGEVTLLLSTCKVADRAGWIRGLPSVTTAVGQGIAHVDVEAFVAPKLAFKSISTLDDPPPQDAPILLDGSTMSTLAELLSLQTSMQGDNVYGCEGTEPVSCTSSIHLQARRDIEAAAARVNVSLYDVLVLYNESLSASDSTRQFASAPSDVFRILSAGQLRGCTPNYNLARSCADSFASLEMLVVQSEVFDVAADAYIILSQATDSVSDPLALDVILRSDGLQGLLSYITDGITTAVPSYMAAGAQRFMEDYIVKSVHVNMTSGTDAFNYWVSTVTSVSASYVNIVLHSEARCEQSTLTLPLDSFAEYGYIDGKLSPGRIAQVLGKLSSDQVLAFFNATSLDWNATEQIPQLIAAAQGDDDVASFLSGSSVCTLGMYVSYLELFPPGNASNMCWIAWPWMQRADELRSILSEGGACGLQPAAQLLEQLHAYETRLRAITPAAWSHQCTQLHDFLATLRIGVESPASGLVTNLQALTRILNALEEAWSEGEDGEDDVTALLPDAVAVMRRTRNWRASAMQIASLVRRVASILGVAVRVGNSTCSAHPCIIHSACSVPSRLQSPFVHA